MGISPLIAGNWKMNGLRGALDEVKALGEMLASGPTPGCAVAICPPATLLAELSRAAHPHGILSGGQDCHPDAGGAHTGDISAQMLADAGARYVIVGHSERRTDHGEHDALVKAKAQAGHGAGLTPIVCVGEHATERQTGLALAVVEQQLAGSVPETADAADLIIAYEPVWAIGTGLTPTLADIAEMHAHIRALLERRFGARGADFLVLYGGSLKPANAKEILGVDHVGGGLVGGASLLAKDLYAIMCAA